MMGSALLSMSVFAWWPRQTTPSMQTAYLARSGGMLSLPTTSVTLPRELDAHRRAGEQAAVNVGGPAGLCQVVDEDLRVARPARKGVEVCDALLRIRVDAGVALGQKRDSRHALRIEVVARQLKQCRTHHPHGLFDGRSQCLLIVECLEWTASERGDSVSPLGQVFAHRCSPNS